MQTIRLMLWRAVTYSSGHPEQVSDFYTSRMACAEMIASYGRDENDEFDAYDLDYAWDNVEEFEFVLHL